MKKRRLLKKTTAILSALLLTVSMLPGTVYADTVAAGNVAVVSGCSDSDVSSSYQNGGAACNVWINGEPVAVGFETADSFSYRDLGAELHCGDQISVEPIIKNPERFANNYVNVVYNNDGHMIMVPDENGRYNYTLEAEPTSRVSIQLIYSRFLNVSKYTGMENGDLEFKIEGNGTLRYGNINSQVSVTVKPDSGYSTQAVRYSADGGENWKEAVFSADGTWKFRPGKDVVVTADFTEENVPSEISISTEEELRNLAELVNEGKWQGCYNIKVKLNNDIELTNEWNPIGYLQIGTLNRPFRGEFDGQGHVISGLKINAEIAPEDKYRSFGLFGNVCGTVKNTKVEGKLNLKDEETSSGTTGTCYAGGISGFFEGGLLTDCTASVDISIEKTNSDKLSYLGGITGYAECRDIDSIIKQCINNGNLSADLTLSCDSLGGIAGAARGKEIDDVIIEKCINYGSLSGESSTFTFIGSGDPLYGHEVNNPYGCVGGLVGECGNTTVKESCNKGEISGSFGYAAGGIAGSILNLTDELNVFDSYNLANITISTKTAKTAAVGVGGIAGARCGANGTGTGTSHGGYTENAPNNGTYNMKNCYNAGSIIIAQTNSIYTNYIFTDPLLLLANGTSENSYSERVAASVLGDSFKDDQNNLQGGWPLLSWESSESESEELAVSIVTNVEDAEIRLFSSSDEAAESEISGTAGQFKVNGGVYYYSVSKDGYVTERGSIAVTSSDKSVQVNLKKAAVVTVKVTPETGNAILLDKNGTSVAENSHSGGIYNYTLYNGESYSFDASAEGYLYKSERIKAKDGAVYEICLVPEEGTDVISSTEGSWHITKGGNYYVSQGYTGSVYVDTAEPVKLTGMGTGESYKDLYISCTVPESRLTVENLYIDNSAGTANALDFTGKGNQLNISGVCVIDVTSGAKGKAAIHVKSGNELTISGGKLFLYKQEMGAGIGGDWYEQNGTIHIKDAELYAKGSKQGAVIGSGGAAGSSKEDPGAITISGSQLYLVAVARGAAIGGSAGNDGASPGTNVDVKDSLININVDYTGAAIGGGGHESGNDSDGGTLTLTNSLVRTYIDYNAIDPTNNGLEDSSDSLWKDRKGNLIAEPGVNGNAAVTASVKDQEGHALYLAEFDTKNLAAGADSDGVYTVKEGDTVVYSGKTVNYGYVNELFYKTDAPAVDYTTDNWAEMEDSMLYLYLTGENHHLTIGEEYYEAVWNSDTNSFTLEKEEPSAYEIAEYAGTMSLVTYTGEVPEGSVVRLEPEATGGTGESVYLNYSKSLNRWMTVLSNEDAERLTSEQFTVVPAESLPEGITRNSQTIAAEGDVNENGRTNIIDAQIAYDIASGNYTNSEEATIRMWIGADVNADCTVTAADARVIQCIIHGVAV